MATETLNFGPGEPPGADFELFGDETDPEDNVYTATELPDPNGQFSEFKEDSYIKTKSKKPENLLNLAHFWHGGPLQELDDAPKSRRNLYWDFMVYANLREARDNKYQGSVVFLQQELLLAVAKCRERIQVDVEVSAGAASELQVEEFNQTFDFLIHQLQRRLKILNADGQWLYVPQGGFEALPLESEVNVAMSKFISAHAEFTDLLRKFHLYKLNRFKLARQALRRCLGYLEEFKLRALSYVFEPNSPQFRKCNMTRFLKHLDRISPRADFFGEYRYSLLKTFVTNAEELNRFIEESALYLLHKDGDGDGDGANDNFVTFVNSFTPGKRLHTLVHLVDYEIPGYEPGKRRESVYGEAEDDEMLKFINETVPDDLIDTMQLNTQPCSERASAASPGSSKSGESAPQSPNSEADAADANGRPRPPERFSSSPESEELQLLRDARRRAAEILRFVAIKSPRSCRVKRLQRVGKS